MPLKISRLSVLAPAATLLIVASALACNDSEFRGRSDKLHPTVTKGFTQDDYPTLTSTHVQGHRGDPGAAGFEQGEWGSLDVVVVIDNSGSMAEEQANLAPKLEALLSQVERADWRISIVTTDASSTCQRALIKKGDSDFKGRFERAISTAGTRGSGLERPFLQAVNALKCQNAGWVRPDSALAVLIVTDEDNCSIDDKEGYGCNNAKDLEGSFLTDYLASIRTLGTDAKIYGIYKKPGDTACTTALVAATKIDAVVEQSHGTWGSICDADYSTTLKAISEDVAQILKYEFDLTDTPDDGTLKIKVDGNDWSKFTLEGKTVRFSEPPPFGAKIEVSYRHGKEGDLDTAFTLEKAPVPGTFHVNVDGQPLPNDEYTWNDATKKVELKNPPAERANIDIVYQEQVPLKDTFDIGTDVNPETLLVVVNNKDILKIVKYDAVSGIITVAPPPPAKSHIDISFKSKD